MERRKARSGRTRARANFPYALRSFIGYLEGTRKSAHTIKNYRLDLLSFQKFLTRGKGKPRLEQLGADDLEHFHAWLRSQGLKTNTRRRKLLTVQRFLAYLSRRNKAAVEVARKYPTPHKIERIPMTVSSQELIRAIRELPSETLLDARNRALLWSLAETGCLVSEVTRLHADDWQPTKVQIRGKSPREVPISSELHEAILRLRSQQSEPDFLFQGFNKFGSLGAPITSRGVELLVRSHAARLGFPELTPRTFRHSAVLRWFSEGLAREEIQRRLGLRTAYAFRVYDAMLSQGNAKSSS
ncbi:MAG: site-specific integrase [Oligoflexia bacterium]|nr:site-specific integrase [Oligoflexia bacterium]